MFLKAVGGLTTLTCELPLELTINGTVGRSFLDSFLEKYLLVIRLQIHFWNLDDALGLFAEIAQFAYSAELFF